MNITVSKEDDFLEIKNAIISVSDKEGIDEIARTLTKFDVTIYSSGGTRKYLEKCGISSKPISDLTKNPEILGGRVKTLSYNLSASLLFDRNNENHLKELKEHDLTKIDLVISNYYPFENHMMSDILDDKLIEHIDIGGPTMMRSCAKNYQYVCGVISKDLYKNFLDEFTHNDGKIGLEFRKKCALKTFKITAEYDFHIYKTFSKRFGDLPSLRYGENPHQSAEFLPFLGEERFEMIASSKKHLSYNNLLDAESAINLVDDFLKAKSSQNIKNANDYNYFSVVIKHNIPCGAAASLNPIQSIEMAFESDPVSAYGSIVATNGVIDEKEASFLKDKFIEVIIAEDFTDQALEILTQKKNLRILKTNFSSRENLDDFEIKRINGGFLLQDKDNHIADEFQSVTKVKFNERKWPLASFATICSKHLKSNAVCVTIERPTGLQLIGHGAGQPNRIDSLRLLALPKAKEFCRVHKLDIGDAVLSSDAFFPFADSIEICHEFGIKYIAQPGGSIRDSEVVMACDLNNIAMSFTGKRFFKH